VIEEIAQVLDAIKKMAETEVKCEDKEGEVCVWVCVGGGKAGWLAGDALSAGGCLRAEGAATKKMAKTEVKCEDKEGEVRWVCCVGI
jgi:NAD(P)H-hydrate repair Nnr-like enzyme with NAD(P)H-hydrate epimerase domain